MEYGNFMTWQFGFTLVTVLVLAAGGLYFAKQSRAKRGEHGHVSHPPADPLNTPRNTAP